MPYIVTCELLNARYCGDEPDFDWSLRESGGQIGPAPDGFVIDVRFVSYGAMWKILNGSKTDQPVETGEIIDAFNDR